MQRALPAGSLAQHDLLRAEALHRRLAHPLLLACFDVVDDRLVEAIDGASRLLARDAGLEPREEVDPVAIATLEPAPDGDELLSHRDRHVDLGPDAERRAVETARGDADDRHRLAVHRDGLSDDRRIGAEPRLPIVVAEHGDGVTGDGLVVSRAEQAS